MRLANNRRNNPVNEHHVRLGRRNSEEYQVDGSAVIRAPLKLERQKQVRTSISQSVIIQMRATFHYLYVFTNQNESIQFYIQSTVLSRTNT